MRKIAANYVFPVSSSPVRNGILVIDRNGRIKDLIDPGEDLRESENLEFYNGILVPGFVNTHTHLELSHLKGKIIPGTGLPRFIFEIGRHRENEKSIISDAAARGVYEMEENGIVAAGDVSNTDVSFHLKAKGKINFHTFVEVFGLKPGEAKDKVLEGIRLLNLIKEKFHHPASLSPHAPYSISVELLTGISEYIHNNPAPVTFHNQECMEELQMFLNNEGKLKSVLEKTGLDMTKWKSPGISSLTWMLENLPEKIKILSVHNTYTPEKDIAIACKRDAPVYWTLCPRANQYIENRLPDVLSILRHSEKITIGTDSLASNKTLSILDELITLHEHFPEISLEKLIRWGTLNGAKALDMDSDLGSFETGKKPGVNLIYGLDLHHMQLTKESKVKPIIQSAQYCNDTTN